MSEESVIFSGPAGRIEGVYYNSGDELSPVALVLHPLSDYGGDMNNPVVCAAYQALVKCKFSVLKINFRGKGRSQGISGTGELNDGAAAIDWLEKRAPESNLRLIAGFSFGAWIAMQLIMRRPEIKHFIALAPLVSKYDFSFLSPCPCPGLIVQGDQDSIVPEEAVAELAERLSKQKKINISYQTIQGADHFFRNKLDLLRSVITQYMENNIYKNQVHKQVAAKLYL